MGRKGGGYKPQIVRGTGEDHSQDPIWYPLVYDHMPAILGDQFRTNSVLSKMLLREAPVDAPFMLKADAYEELGLRYVKEKNYIPALECYRIALQARTTFADAIGRLGDTALLSRNEADHLEISMPLELRLLAAGLPEPDIKQYTAWVHIVYEANEHFIRINKDHYDDSRWEEDRRRGSVFKITPENVIVANAYIDSCLGIGKYKEATACARELGKEAMEKVALATPQEILDIAFLKKYIDDNFPESTFGQGSIYSK